MYGAIIGDIVGSVYEGNPIKTTEFPLFANRASYTDDTVLTVAVAKTLLEDGDYISNLKHFTRTYAAGYGASFYDWAMSPVSTPYNSWGNGAAMRVSPVAWALDEIDDVLAEAQRSAEVTHNHPEGIKGAQAVALSILLARKGADKSEIKSQIEDRFDYDLDRSLADIRPGYCFDVSSQGSVPESIIAFLESTDFESSLRNAVSLGGDSDTMACMSGSIAEAIYGAIPAEIVEEAATRLEPEFLEIIKQFSTRYSATFNYGDQSEP